MPIPMLLPAILQGVGGLLNVGGAITKKNAAQDMLAQQMSFAAGQKTKFNEGVRGVRNLIQSTQTYKPDVELYKQAEERAAQQERQASAMGRMPGEDIARQQIGQNAANAMAAARQGARSGTDLMTAALLGQSISGGQNLEIDKQAMMQKQARLDQAKQQYMNSLYQTAAENARQRQLAYTSEAQKQQSLINFEQNALQTELGQDYQFFQDEKRAKGAYADTVGSIYSGVGDIFTGVASGLMASNAASEKAKELRDMLSMYSMMRGGGGSTATSPSSDYSASIAGFKTFANQLPPSLGGLPSWGLPRK